MVPYAEALTGLVLILLGWLAVEAVLQRRALRRIPVRVHVNGTRGKSSVTRLVAAGLRAGGQRVVAKTTGTLARVLLPNARELPVYRPLGANVREQIRIARFAVASDAQVLVIECMALQPVLQWLSERMFVRATHGVITNARPDHLDVMGPTGDDVARALAGTVPPKGMLFTAEHERLSILAHAAADRKAELVPITEHDVADVTDGDMEGFAFHEHRENVALALQVCAALGVDRETALSGMKSGRPDPGALSFFEVDFFGRRMVFVNGFAANDPVSSHQIWELSLEKYPGWQSLCVVNCRADRADRSRQLGEGIAQWTPPDRVATVGDGTVFFSRAAQRGGFDGSRLVNLERLDARDVFERIVELTGKRTVVVGIGNIGGLGLELTRMFRNRARLTEENSREPS